MNNNCLFFWRPYLSLLILNSIYVLYAYIRFEKSPEIPLTGFAAFFNGALIRSHSDDPKTNVLYSYMIPLIYLPPNEPNILLQRPMKNLKMDDCWLMTGSKADVEIELENLLKWIILIIITSIKLNYLIQHRRSLLLSYHK